MTTKDKVHLDYETFSAAPIRDVGAYRYAYDPSTEILMAAVAINNEEPHIILSDEYHEKLGIPIDPEGRKIAKRWVDKDVLVYAHNAMFEWAISKCCHHWWRLMGLGIPTMKQFRCTAAMARRAGMPAHLGSLAIALGIEQQKDTKGSALIRKFSCPRVTPKLKGKRTYAWDEPEEFMDFINYCLQDVRAEQSVDEKLSLFDLKGKMLEAFQFDQEVNDFGVPFNIDALRTAKRIVTEERDKLSEQFVTLTGLNPTQTVKVNQWLVNRGYPYSDLQAVSVSKALADTSWATSEEAKEALTLRSKLSFAAVNKIDKILDCECEDGRVMGTLLFHGAGTARWAGRLIQPQNFKRPTIKYTDEVYDYICNQPDANAEDLRLLYGEPLEVISSCIRHFMQPPEGKLILDADYSNIEARIVCWIADQYDALERFRNNEDPYIAQAAIIFQVDKGSIGKSSMERWVGKQSVLGCGYQMGVETFLRQCLLAIEKFGMDIEFTRELAEMSVRGYRKLHNKVASLWYETDDACRKAIKYPGKKFNAGSKINFVVMGVNGIKYLFMLLPSGRTIAYPKPALELDKKTGKTNITFFGTLPNSTKWGRVKTYGGKLVENAVQGLAFDLMANGGVNARNAGFNVFTLIHDQALAEWPKDTAKEALDTFISKLTELPSWAKGLPLKADGNVTPYYVKD